MTTSDRWKADGESFGNSYPPVDDPRSASEPWVGEHTGKWHAGKLFLIQDEHAVLCGKPIDALSVLFLQARLTAQYPSEVPCVQVLRIVADIATSDMQDADAFYAGVLGLDLAMDHGWIRTYTSKASMTVQVSFANEGGSGTPVPALSIEVDDLDEALRRVEEANIPIEYGPASEPWGVRRFFVRDPFGKLVNILQHASPSAG